MVVHKAWEWWTRDTALHTYVYAQLLITVPSSVFGTYTNYQLQTTGFAIGRNSEGGPCETYCIVPWAGTSLDLNSVLLYMSAFGIGLSGFVSLFLSAYSDFWAYKHLLVTLLFIMIGAISVPVFWLRGSTNYNFQVLSGLSIVSMIGLNILVLVLNIYIPYCMRNAAAAESAPIRGPNENDSKKRNFGFKMAVWGAIANSIGAMLMYVVVIIVTETTTAVQYPGLLITTIVGFITIAGSAVTYLGLPRIPSKPTSDLVNRAAGPLIEFLRPFADLLKRRSMAILLISYTIYTDTTYAIGSVTSQLFFNEIRPSPLENTLYALTATICGVICTVLFLFVQPRVSIRLETWLLIGYGIELLLPLWGIIGFAYIDFGYKERWEFYVQIFLSTASGVIVNSVFRVLFSEMIPPRNEVRWFSLQYILSSATVWVNYVASAPLQNATHQLRFPLLLSLIFLACAFVLELTRVLAPFFKRDREKWMEYDLATAQEEARNSNSYGSADDNTITENGGPDKIGGVVVSSAKMQSSGLMNHRVR